MSINYIWPTHAGVAMVVTRINASVFSLSSAYFTIWGNRPFYGLGYRAGTRCAFINNEVQFPSVIARARETVTKEWRKVTIDEFQVKMFPDSGNSFAGRNKFLKDPTSARSATAGRKIPAVTLRDLDVVGIHDCTFWKFGPGGGSRAGWIINRASNFSIVIPV